MLGLRCCLWCSKRVKLGDVIDEGAWRKMEEVISAAGRVPPSRGLSWLGWVGIRSKESLAFEARRAAPGGE